MTARGLHGLVPSRLLRGRWLLVLVCYLDDSGQDPQNTVTTLAGYIAREGDWKQFEGKIEPIFTKPGSRFCTRWTLKRPMANSKAGVFSRNKPS